MAQYPTSVVSYTTKTNQIDTVDASHINDLQNEVIALQTYVGTYPQGSKASLTERLAVCLSTNGAINGSNGFPVNTTPMRLFYRTDQETLYIRRYDNTSEQAIGGSLSNVIYHSGIEDTKSWDAGFAQIVGTNTLLGQLTATKYTYWTTTQGSTFGTIRPEIRWTKIQGVSTLKFIGKIWQLTADGQTQSLQVAMGSASGTTTALANTQTPTEVTCNVDITGLAAGTTYTIVISERRQTTSSVLYLGEHMLMGA